MNTPKLRFKEFNKEWKTCSIGDITESLKSGLSRLLQHQDIGIPVIRANNIENGRINYNDLKYWYIDDPQGADTSNYIVKKDDILINFINSEAKMGTTAIVTDEPFRKMIYTTNILRMTTNELADNYFFYCYSSTKKYKDYIKLITKPAVNQASFTTVDFKKHKIKLPTIKEQIKISNFLKRINQKIQLQQEKIDLLKDQKKGYMQKIFSQESRFKDENGEKFPDWSRDLLNRFATINPKSNSLDNQFRYIDLEAVNDGELLATNIISKQDAPSRAQRVVSKGDILYQTVRPYQKNNLLYNFDFLEQVVASTGYAQIKAKDRVSATFLYQYLNTEKFTYHVLQRCTGTSYPAINSSDLGEIEIRMPILKEQQKIAAFLSKLDEKTFLEKKYLNELQRQKQAFMQQMFI